MKNYPHVPQVQYFNDFITLNSYGESETHLATTDGLPTGIIASRQRQKLKYVKRNACNFFKFLNTLVITN